MPDINLIPQSEKKAQKKKQAIKSSSVVTIVLFIIAAISGGFLFYKTNNIKRTIKSHENDIEALRGDIRGLEDIEITARNLGMRYETLKDILDTRNNYSILLQEFEKRIPDTVVVETFGTGRESTINVSGVGTDYIAIAKFVSNFRDDAFKGAEEGLEGLFTDVTLNSVNLDTQTDKARFFIVVTISEDFLR